MLKITTNQGTQFCAEKMKDQYVAQLKAGRHVIESIEVVDDTEHGLSDVFARKMKPRARFTAVFDRSWF